MPLVLMRHYEATANLTAVFTRPAKLPEPLPSDFEFVAADQKVTTTLLLDAVTRKELGMPILLYGPTGTGKSELAKVAAQAAGPELYVVECADRDGNALNGPDRYRSLQIRPVFFKGSRQLALLFDEAEDVFPPISTAQTQRNSWRAWTPVTARAMAVSAPA